MTVIETATAVESKLNAAELTAADLKSAELDATNFDSAELDQLISDETDADEPLVNIVEPIMFERIARRVSERPEEDLDVSWRAHASCKDTDPDLFFPVGTTGLAIEQIEQAKTVCMGCSAQIPCLEFALIANQDTGVWGGSSEEERRGLRRKYLSRRRSRL